MKFYLVTLSIIFLSACAQINPLTGGNRDIIAPKLNLSKTFPKPGELNYQNQNIVLTFDEYIVLKNPTNNISITPQPNAFPQITSKNKKVFIKFKEPLEDNTTYSISFNGAIADYNEGNDSIFQFVFSTGNFIDSIICLGQVKNAFTNKPTSSVLVGLYPVSNSVNYDSIPYLIKPIYITQTNKSGEFKLNYIKSGKYYAFSFIDKDKNLLFNPNTEPFSFLNEKEIDLTKDKDSVIFRLYSPQPKNTRLKNYELVYPGKLSIVFNQMPQTSHINLNQPYIEEQTGKKDSLIYWLKNKYDNKKPIIIQYDNQIDTIKPIMKKIPKKENLQAKYKTNIVQTKLLPFDTLSLIFNLPIKSVDTSAIHFYNSDSVKVKLYTSIINAKTLQLEPVNRSSAKYFIVDSNAVKFYNSKATNTKIGLSYDVHPNKFLGQLIVDLTLDSLVQGFLEVLDSDGHLVKKINDIEISKKINLNKLIPGTYQLRFVHDKNRDQVYTTGLFLNKRQPENTYYYTSTIKVRSNWDLEIQWEITP